MSDTPSRPVQPRISLAGSSAVLFDAAGGRFCDAVQSRIWELAGRIGQHAGVCEATPGMNNLLVTFDPFETPAQDIQRRLTQLWPQTGARQVAGRLHEIPVSYGGALGEDLCAWAQHCGLPIEEAVRRHAAPEYTVAAIGSMPGFPYLSGLDPALAWPRRPTPRLRVEEGSIMIGGQQTAVMSMAGASGWHVLGRARTRLFDPAADSPSLLRIADRVRFVIADIAP